MIPFVPVVLSSNSHSSIGFILWSILLIVLSIDNNIGLVVTANFRVMEDSDDFLGSFLVTCGEWWIQVQMRILCYAIMGWVKNDEPDYLGLVRMKFFIFGWHISKREKKDWRHIFSTQHLSLPLPWSPLMQCIFRIQEHCKTILCCWFLEATANSWVPLPRV